jgi:glucan phosphoethanolaminetransferase (alkaline phosphatase superfamily)
MTETNIINIGPFVVTFLITLLVAVFALRRRSVDGGGSFSLWAFILALWNLGYIFELTSRTLKGKIFWDDLQTALVALFPVAFLFFAIQYSRRKPRRMNWIWAALLFLAAASIALIYTNPYHHLVISAEWLIPGGPYADLDHQYAPPAFIMLGVFTLVLLAGIFLLVQRLFDPHWIYRAQVATIIIGTLLCLAGIVLTILDYPIYLHRDNSPFFNSIASLIIAYGLFRYRLFDLMP